MLLRARARGPLLGLHGVHGHQHRGHHRPVSRRCVLAGEPVGLVLQFGQPVAVFRGPASGVDRVHGEEHAAQGFRHRAPGLIGDDPESVHDLLGELADGRVEPARLTSPGGLAQHGPGWPRGVPDLPRDGRGGRGGGRGHPGRGGRRAAGGCGRGRAGSGTGRVRRGGGRHGGPAERRGHLGELAAHHLDLVGVRGRHLAQMVHDLVEQPPGGVTPGRVPVYVPAADADQQAHQDHARDVQVMQAVDGLERRAETAGQVVR